MVRGMICQHACYINNQATYISNITSDFTKTTFYFITFYSHKYYVEARSQGGNGGKMTQCNTI